MKPELKPCPFCEQSDNLIIQHLEGTINHPSYRVYCDNCGASNGYTDKNDHMEKWNHRTSVEQLNNELSTFLIEILLGAYNEIELIERATIVSHKYNINLSNILRKEN